MSRRDLAAEIRAARPAAPETLRARVRALPGPVPSPAPAAGGRLRALLRRRVLVLSLPAAAVAAGAVVAVVLVTRSSPAQPAAATRAASPSAAAGTALKRAAPARPATSRALAPAERVGEVVVPYGGSVADAVETGGRVGVFVDLPTAQQARVTKLLRRVGSVSVVASGPQVVELLVIVARAGASGAP